jgi:prohibitin 1
MKELNFQQIGLAFVGFLILCLTSIVTIEPGEVGVRSTMGTVHSEIMASGIHVVIPILDTVTTFSTRTENLPEEFLSITKDGQVMKVAATALYSINPIKAPTIYSQIGTSIENIKDKVIQPALLGAVKQVISKYGMFEVIENQNQVSVEVESTIKQMLGENDFIQFDSFTVTGFTLDPQVQASIEQKQIAQQQLQRKSIEVEIAGKEAERLNILSKSITTSTLMSDAIDKWDGHGIPPTAGQGLSLLVQSK